jgi:hypothetical protein
MVVADLRAREAVGIERYGVPLRPFNGRDISLDAYQEVLDLAVYLRTLTEETKRLREILWDSTLTAPECLDRLRQLWPPSM